MKVVKGIYKEAKVFTDIVDEACVEQIKGHLDLEAFQEVQVRIMQDCHAGAGCVVGIIVNLGDKVIHNIVGVDIGCGMLTVKLNNVEADFLRLDEIVRNKIPYEKQEEGVFLKQL